MRYQNSEFWNQNSNFLTLQTLEFKKYFPTGIFGIKNGIRVPLTMGVPEIGTKNWNSQPSCLDYRVIPYFRGSDVRRQRYINHAPKKTAFLLAWTA